MNIKYKIKEVKPRIFLAEFEDQYDMCMTFLRYQETYESPNSKFRNKDFNILEFMRWYSKKYGEGNFTYTTDWGGFNFPSEIYYKTYPGDEDHHNIYDYTMDDIVVKVVKQLYQKYNQNSKITDYNFHSIEYEFYLIGALKGNKKTIDHEVAHGLYYTNKEYKKEMVKLVKQLKPSLKKKFYAHLKKIGYTEQVFVDECQAYFSTGIPENFGLKLKDENKPFIEVFKKYNKG